MNWYCSYVCMMVQIYMPAGGFLPALLLTVAGRGRFWQPLRLIVSATAARDAHNRD